MTETAWGPKPRAPVKVVARFEGRARGDEHPVGIAVSGDGSESEMTAALGQIVLPSGVRLDDHIAEIQIPELTHWLKTQTWDPLPRALVRLLADSAQRGEQIRSQSGIIAFWESGVPPREVWDGPATLAPVIGLPIKLFYEADTMMVVVFEA
jgi:hypothetical protein